MKEENRIDTTRDHMPREVATELLAEPDSKATAKARREYSLARAIVRPSARPIVRVGEDYEYMEFQKRSNVNVLEAQKCNASQLNKRLARAVRHRRNIQRKWQALQDKLAATEDEDEKKSLKTLIDAHDRLVKYHVDPRIEVFEDEVNRRTQ